MKSFLALILGKLGDRLAIIVAVVLFAASAFGVWQLNKWRDAYVMRTALIAEIAGLREALAAERKCLPHSDCALRLEIARADGAIAVAEATVAAHEQLRLAEERIAEHGRAVVKQAAAATKLAQSRVSEWERRYQDATSASAVCRAWAAQEVPCPVN